MQITTSLQFDLPPAGSLASLCAGEIGFSRLPNEPRARKDYGSDITAVVCRMGDRVKVDITDPTATADRVKWAIDMVYSDFSRAGLSLEADIGLADYADERLRLSPEAQVHQQTLIA